MSSHVPMDANTKVSKYLANLSCTEACRNVSSPHINTSTLQTVRGPGQTAHDPLQFVSTSGVSLAENARKLISITEQQRRERAKLAHNGPLFDDNDSWQEDLDTWRRKRKTKVVGRRDYDNVSSLSKDYTKEYNSLPNYGRSHKDTKEEILTITSPSSHHEDQNDSGIENRTTDSHSPSTSLDFSPRSDSKHTPDRLISSKVPTTPPTTTESSSPPDYPPPPPPPAPLQPPTSSDSTLDQVLIPLNVSRTISAIQRKPDIDDYPSSSLHLQRFGRRTPEPSSGFESIFKEIRSLRTPIEGSAVIPKQVEESKPDIPTVDLTVELNREQRGQVTAIRYPTTRKIETLPFAEDEKETTLISQISHYVNPSLSSARPICTRSSSPQSRYRNMPPTTVYRTVDIPFDESPATYQPKKDENATVVKVTMGTHPVHKGFGFSVSMDRGRPTIDSVVVGTPADRAGLLIGDRVVAINGEHLNDKYPSAINRLLHEAARLGEAEVCIERRDAKTPQVKSISSLENFDRARSVFAEKPVDSYAEFKRKHNRVSRADSPFFRDFSSLPRSTSTGSLPTTKRENSSLGAHRIATRQYYDSTSNVRTEYRTHSSSNINPDYKVTSMHEKIGPGKLTDFVPESERNVVRTTSDERRDCRRTTDEEPRLIRNYDLPPASPTTKITSSTTVTSFPLSSSFRQEDDTVSAIPKRSTLPRNSHVETRTQHDDDLLAEKCYSRKIHRETYSHSPPVETLRRSSEISESFPTRTTADYWRSALPQRERRHESYELRDRTTKRDYAPDYDARKAVVREEYKFDEMYCKRNYRPDVGQRSDYYYPRTTDVPIQRLETDYYRSTSRPRPFHTARSKSSDMILEREYNCRRDDGRISDVIHRFYDRDGNSINRQVKRGCDLDIRRDYSPARDKRRRSLRDSHVHPRISKSLERRYEERHEYEEMEKRMWIPDKRVVVGVKKSESRDWRNVINQQRQATPGRPPDTQRIRDASSSLGNLPAIINRKLEETRKLEKEQRQTTEYGYRRTMDDRYTDIDNYDKATNYRRFEKSYSPEYRNRQYDSLRYDKHDALGGGAIGGDLSVTSEYRRREPSPSAGYSKRETNVAFREEIRREPINNDQVVAVSGKHQCAHCGDELGRGAAMIIESLNLFYHLACFKCYVCKTTLGSGATGADVRVREGRLHCQSCYSNDRMQLSKV